MIQKIKLNKKLTEVNQILNTAIERISFQIDEAGGQIKSDFDHNDVLVKIDELHVSNALFNLLDISFSRTLLISISYYGKQKPFDFYIEGLGFSYCFDISKKYSYYMAINLYRASFLLMFP